MSTTFGSNPHVDDAAWNQTKLIRQGLTMVDKENEFSEVVHAVIMPTESLVSYEKSLRVTEVRQADPSDYTDPAKPIQRDACGDDSRATIAAGNLTGRAWGGYSDVVVEPGADGLAIAKELSLFNDGVDQPQLDQNNSKYMLLLTPKGSQPVTAAVYPIASGRYHLGFVMRTDAFTDNPNDSFLALYLAGSNNPLFRVDSNGNLTHVFGRTVIVRQMNGFDVLTLG